DAAVGVARRAALVQLAAALVAEAGAQVVLAAALRAVVGQLAAGHGHERALGPLDDLQVAHHEGVVEGHRAERLKALVLLPAFHELNPDFGDNHSCTPYFCGPLRSNSEPRTLVSPRRLRRREGYPHVSRPARRAPPRPGRGTGRTGSSRCRSSARRPAPAGAGAPARPPSPA